VKGPLASLDLPLRACGEGLFAGMCAESKQISDLNKECGDGRNKPAMTPQKWFNMIGMR
jgi:hypothetical protein